MTKKEIAQAIKNILDRDLNFDFRPVMAYQRLKNLAEEMEQEENDTTDN